METKLNAQIISLNIDSEAVCAAAARISTTPGGACEIFESSKISSQNQDLIKKVLRSGHKSIIEHAVFTIALRDVSAFAEQFFIENRLASFTVKSRRYVDFGRLGYYVPAGLDGADLELYRRYMDTLFKAYSALIDDGAPKEDARFLLPYSFNSNFYCTVNARELAHIIRAVRYGHGRHIPELRDLANQLESQLETVFPCLLPELGGACCEESTPDLDFVQGPSTLIEPKDAGMVRLVDYPQNPLELLKTAHSIRHPGSKPSFELASLLESDRPRELEQLSYSFIISNVTLSGITHITRHRIQSIIIPPIRTLDFGKCIMPETIKSDPFLYKKYVRALETASGLLRQVSGRPELERHVYYFALSGNVMDIMTTMNVRELMHFTRLRACNRAQWEVRSISIEMLRQLRNSFPELFDSFGPSCYVKGHCPEGGMACGRMDEVVSRFSQVL